MFSHASTTKEIKLATSLRDTFVIAPLNDELCYEKGENITHFAIEHRRNLQYIVVRKREFPVHVFCQELYRKKRPFLPKLKDYRKSAFTSESTFQDQKARLLECNILTVVPNYFIVKVYDTSSPPCSLDPLRMAMPPGGNLFICAPQGGAGKKS